MQRLWRILIPVGLLAGGLILAEQYGLITLPYSYRRLNKYMSLIEKAGLKYGVDPRLIASIIWQESRGDPNAVSSVGAIGLMQIMPSTAQAICGLSSEHLFSPALNIDCGTRYLKHLINLAGGNIKDAIAKYYAGPRARATWRGGTPPVYQYVAEVMGHYRAISV